ncbi:histidyl-tRNA synthetase [compost metagenome]
MDLEKLKPVILLQGSNEEKLNSLRTVLAESATGMHGIAEIETVFRYIKGLLQSNPELNPDLELDITLARGLNYYTGCIFEVKRFNWCGNFFWSGSHLRCFAGTEPFPGISSCGNESPDQ